MNRTTWLFVCVALFAPHAEAANRTVCQSGCQYTSLQTAINDAVPGDVILLRAGETFVGNFVLTPKDSAATQFITIRSNARDSSLPGEGIRLIREGSQARTSRAARCRSCSGRVADTSRHRSCAPLPERTTIA